MRPVSAAWRRTVVASHRALFRATVCSQFQTGTAPEGERIPVLGGDVILDGTAHIRSTLDLTTAGSSLAGVLMWPVQSTDLLAPYGNEIYIERGIQYTDGQVEYVGLGYFRINTPDQDELPIGPIRISGSDRMAGLIDAKLITPQQFMVGASLGYVVSTLVQQVYPAATVEWDDDTDDVLLTRSLSCDFDRYEFLDKLIRSQGKIWYWDHRGILVIRSVPDPSKPVWDIHSGPGGVLVRVARRLTREGVFNIVVAAGEAVDSFDPPTAIAVDDSPLSPTYVAGKFGQVPYFHTDAAIQTRAQAEASAEAELRRRIGMPHSMDLSAVPNPALEPYDPVSVRVPDGTLRTFVLDRLTVPLEAEQSMTASTREQTDMIIKVTSVVVA